MTSSVFRMEGLEVRTLMSAAAGGETANLLALENASVVAGNWIVELDGVSGTPSRQLSVTRKRTRGVAADLRVRRQLGQDGLFLVSLDPTLTSEQAHARLAALPGFVRAQPDYLYKVQAAPNDPSFDAQWALENRGQNYGTVDADLDAPEAWNMADGSGVVVGVLDTGIDYNHPDLASNIWTNPFEIPGNGIDDEGNGYVDDVYGWDFYSQDNDPNDENGHGTHTAGIIAAVRNNGIGVAGVAPGAKVMALKIASAAGYVSTSGALQAINYARWMQSHGVNIRVLNNSWGGNFYDQAMSAAISSAGNSGMLVVCGAGNGSTVTGLGLNNDALPFYPASYSAGNVISVASLNRYDGLATNSNYGATSVDVGAPGVEILSTWMGGGYVWNSGTSMASPMVAGVAALAFSASPGANWQAVRDAIYSSVDPVAALAGKTVTGGRVNAAATVAQFAMTAPSIPDLLASSDSGVSNSDNITNDNTPTFVGTVQPGALVQLFSNGQLVGSTTANSAGAWTITSSPLGDGLRHIHATATPPGSSASVSSPFTSVWIDTTPPRILGSAEYVYQTAPHRLQFAFSEDVGATLDAADLFVQNTTTGSVATAGMSYSPSVYRATFTFNSVLPDGYYHASINRWGVTDRAGNWLVDNSSDFYFLRGDANHDGAVNIADLKIITANWLRSSVTFATGDLNYSGTVDSADLSELSNNWQRVLSLIGRGEAILPLSLADPADSGRTVDSLQDVLG